MLHTVLQAILDETVPADSACRDVLQDFLARVNSLLEKSLKREEEVAGELEKARLITEHSSDMLMIFTLQGRCEYISPSCRSIIGYTEEELLMQSPFAYVHREDIGRVRREQVRLMHSHEPKSLIVRARRKSGEFIWLETITKMIHDDREKQKKVLAVSRDISQRVSAEENLYRINRELLHIKSHLELQTYQLESRNAELQAAREQAVAADHAKSAFLSSMSHELRTPLNAILGFAQILQKDSSLPDKQRDYIDIMYRSGNHLLDMINDVLDISRIESGKMEILQENVNLRTMLQEIASMFEMRVLEKKLAFELRLPDNLPEFVNSDGKRIRQVLINLLGNAVKFTKQGKISLELDFRPNAKDTCSLDFEFKVSDTGIGIAAEELKIIFEPFRQSRKSYSEGSGLGLAISKRIARLMGGDITVRSTVGEGSVFTLLLTFYVPGGIALMSQEEKNIVGIKNNLHPRILIADDTMSNRVVANALLEPVGFTCIEAENGKQALDKIRTEKPDLVLMDLRMPIMGGLEALQQLRATPELSDIPVVALTASGFSLTREELMKQGFDDFVMKPFAIEQLYETIARLLDIEYAYEGEQTAVSVSKPGEDSGGGDVLSALRKLNGEHSSELRDAIETQDFDAVKKIISSLAQNFPDEAVGLSPLYNAAANADYKYFSDLSARLGAEI